MRRVVKGIFRTGLAGALILATAAQSQDWASTPWHVKCMDPTGCTPADEIYGSLLEHASGWLSSLGFASPWLAPDSQHPGNFVAEVNDGRITVTDSATGESIEYVGIYFSNAKQLVLRSDQYFTLGEPGQAEDDSDYQHELIFQFTPVHELFHAVQNTHLRMDQFTSQQDKQAVDWIIEGTATAVQVEYARAFNPELGAQRDARSYSTPLHKPDPDETRGTWSFWSGVGEQIGSQDRITWIRDVIEPGRVNASNALDRVDDALASHGGLFQQLPRFFATLPPERFEPETHRAAPSELPATYRFRTVVKEVAGKGAAVTVAVPGNDETTVHFSLEPGHPDLHLIVDGELHPQPVAVYKVAAGSDRTFNVVVVNVARKASDSRERATRLKMMLLDGCNFSADVSGDISGNFPGQVAYFNAFEDGQGVETGLAAGTAVDPGMHDQLQGLMGITGNLAEMAERMGLQLDEDTKRKLQSAADGESRAVEEAKEWEQDLLHSGSDTFGITLQSAQHGGMAALLGAGFNMGISGEHSMPQGPGLVGAIDLQPTMVYASGPLVDGNSEAVKFVWEPGEPGYVNVTMNKADDLPLVYGVVNAELHAERSYDGRRPKINVRATFAALQGFESCIR